MTKLKDAIITGLAAVLVGCAAHNMNIRNTPETHPIPAQIQLDEEQVRVNVYGKDIAERAVAFGPAVMQDITSGRLKIKLGSLPKETEHLNATYRQASAQNSAEITLQCQPNNRECFTDALEHEIGHHLYNSLSEAQRIDINVAIIKRLQQPDAKDFQKEIAQIDQRYEKLAKIINQQVIPIAHCFKLQEDLGWGEKAVKDLTKAGISYSPSLAAELKATGAKYSFYMPDCTPEKLSKAQSEIPPMQENLEILVQQISAIYHHKTDFSPELPEVDITVTSIPPAAQALDFFKAKKAYSNALNALIDERINSSTIMDDSEAYQVIIKLSKEILMYQIHQTIDNMGSMIFSVLKYPIGGHDSELEEQFAAVIDSLVDSYNGPITTNPMKLRLDEPLLQALEPLEYKGEKNLASLVEQYRQKLQSEVKLMPTP